MDSVSGSAVPGGGRSACGKTGGLRVLPGDPFISGTSQEATLPCKEAEAVPLLLMADRLCCNQLRAARRG